MKIEAWKTVYSYMWPEVKMAIARTLFGPCPSKDATLEELMGGFFDKFVQSPKEMDELHIPILQKWVKTHRDTLRGIEIFDGAYAYPTAGSEEGIREFMTYLLEKGVTEVYVLPGEYEGYKEVAETRAACSKVDISGVGLRGEVKTNQHIRVMEADLDGLAKVKPSWVFISNPSAKNGNIISNEIVKLICEMGHKVFYDLAYFDSTRRHIFDLSHPNIHTVVMSFSKPYGMFYWRMGALFSRECVPSLYGNKWFKVVPSLLVAENIIDTIEPNFLFERYRPVQQDIVQQMRDETGLPIEMSDALLLAHINPENTEGIHESKTEAIRQFKRADGYRFCLTPYYRKVFG